jgi:2,4-dienoyl-CoA reductase-like NADH-dependent reductase (Old Yellow Enzyme family)
MTSHRKTAQQAGKTKYFTGKPCKYGHITERVTANGNCCACVQLKKAEADKKYRLKNAEKIKAHDRLRPRRSVSQEKIKAQKKRHYEKHKDAIAKKLKVYRDNHKDKKKAYFKEYKTKHAVKVSAWNAKRRAAKIQRTPLWLTTEELWLIEQAYELAALRTKTFGFDWHVDHVLPLQGKTVSGLHVPINVQVIPGSENAKKGNRIQP